MDERPRNGKEPDLGTFWTVPNALSIVRLVLIFPLVYLILIDGPLLWILGLVVVAIATDYFDGRLARWAHAVSEWGKVLDPLADKLAGGLVVGALVIRGALPVWFVTVIVARDLLILGGGLILIRRTGQVPSAHFSGKVAVTAVSITVLAALLRADPPVVEFSLTATAVLLAWSFLRYLVRFIGAYARNPHGTGTPGGASEGG